MPKSSGVPPLPLLVAMAAKHFSADPTKPHLYSGVNYVAGVLLVRICIDAYVSAKIKEAKYR
jgi:hypothetical protein